MAPPRTAPMVLAMSYVIALAGLCAGAPCAAVAAERGARAASAMALEGRCQKLVVMGDDRSSACASQVLNMSYGDGRTGFYFGTKDGTMVVFSSDGNKQKTLNADTVSTPVDRLLITIRGVVKDHPAQGACVFGNPNLRPVVISCTASSKGEASAAKFLSNMKEPKIETFGRSW